MNMKQYNFDEIVNRRGSNCIKYDALSQFFGSGDILPLWVADTDFRTPDFIMEAIRQRMEHEILGYTFRGVSFYDAIMNWIKRHHGWEVTREWISFTPGVVSALTIAIMAFTEPGDKVIVQPPVYFPFFECIRGTGRKLVENPLKRSNGRYTFDLENLEHGMDENTRMLLLCSPHNPGGMVWRREELEALHQLCHKKNIMVVSDEIHADLLFKGQEHIPYAMVSEDAALNTIVCMAPSKTFNVAGLSTSYVIIPNQEIKKKFDKLVQTLHIHSGNITGTVALEAAYRQGDEWLAGLMDYVEDNYNFLEAYLTVNLPEVKAMRPEATFLVWLDFRHYGMDDEMLSRFLVEEAKTGLNNGARFGTGGDGFQRINIGCPRIILAEALQRIKTAFTSTKFLNSR
jgi:cysteine-S-conjugate beta-lyase